MGRERADYRKQYVRIADDLRKSIATGRYPIGESLPPTKDLAERYGVAGMTISNAMAVLRDEGLIKTRQGAQALVIATPDAPAEAEEPEAGEEFALIMQAVQAIRDDVAGLKVRLDELERNQGRTHDR